MELLIKYKNNSTRRVNLTASFFGHNLKDKVADPGVSKKALDFAYDCGTDPYYVGVFKGTTPVFETYIRKNQPDEIALEPFMVVDEKKIKKKLRNQFKNKQFTEKHVFQF